MGKNGKLSKAGQRAVQDGSYFKRAVLLLVLQFSEGLAYKAVPLSTELYVKYQPMRKVLLMPNLIALKET
jgi:hypothetical protein